MRVFDSKKLLKRQNKKWILVDFDGVVHPTKSDFEIKYKPIKGAREALAEFRKRGYKIKIYTARAWHEYVAIEKYLEHWKIPFDGIFCGKVLGKLLIDGAAYRFNGDWKKARKEVLDILERDRILDAAEKVKKILRKDE